MRILVLLIIGILTTSVCEAQRVFREKKTSEVVIDNDTLYARFNVKKKAKIRCVKNKVYAWYKAGNLVFTRSGYDGKLLHGQYTEYQDNRNLKKQGKYCKGLKRGEWKEWFPNGELKEKTKYKAGLKHGNSIFYNEKNEIVSKTVYKKDKAKAGEKPVEKKEKKSAKTEKEKPVEEKKQEKEKDKKESSPKNKKEKSKEAEPNR